MNFEKNSRTAGHFFLFSDYFPEKHLQIQKLPGQQDRYFDCLGKIQQDSKTDFFVFRFRSQNSRTGLYIENYKLKQETTKASLGLNFFCYCILARQKDRYFDFSERLIYLENTNRTG